MSSVIRKLQEAGLTSDELAKVTRALGGTAPVKRPGPTSNPEADRNGTKNKRALTSGSSTRSSSTDTTTSSSSSSSSSTSSASSTPRARSLNEKVESNARRTLVKSGPTATSTPEVINDQTLSKNDGDVDSELGEDASWPQLFGEVSTTPRSIQQVEATTSRIDRTKGGSNPTLGKENLPPGMRIIKKTNNPTVKKGVIRRLQLDGSELSGPTANSRNFKRGGEDLATGDVRSKSVKVNQPNINRSGSNDEVPDANLIQDVQTGPQQTGHSKQPLPTDGVVPQAVGVNQTTVTASEGFADEPRGIIRSTITVSSVPVNSEQSTDKVANSKLTDSMVLQAIHIVRYAHGPFERARIAKMIQESLVNISLEDASDLALTVMQSFTVSAEAAAGAYQLNIMDLRARVGKWIVGMTDRSDIEPEVKKSTEKVDKESPTVLGAVPAAVRECLPVLPNNSKVPDIHHLMSPRTVENEMRKTKKPKAPLTLEQRAALRIPDNRSENQGSPEKRTNDKAKVTTNPTAPLAATTVRPQPMRAVTPPRTETVSRFPCRPVNGRDRRPYRGWPVPWSGRRQPYQRTNRDPHHYH